MNRKKYKKPAVVGVYPRKLLFFLVVFSLSFAAFSYFNNNRIGADQIGQDNIYNGEDVNVEVEVKSDGSIFVDNKQGNYKVNFLNDADEIRIKILDNPSNYIDNFALNLKLPSPVATETKHNILAIHGVTRSYSEAVDSSTIAYYASDIAPTATITIVAAMPKGTINPSLIEKLTKSVSSLEFSFWVYLVLILPAIAFIGMLVFIKFTYRINKVDNPEKAISSPPMAIPPALVGVLYHQRVTPREVAATLVDLALRKDIYILDRERGFAFGKGKFDQRLLGYEKLLLSKIFKNNMSASQEYLQQKIQNQVYSKKVSMVSAGIYAIATRLGYFRQNPRKIHAKYWLFGTVAMLVGLAGFAMSFITKTLPSFTAFFWVGMMISALVIIIMSAYIPMRTELGNEALSNWLAFRKFLADPSPIEYSPTVFQLFEAYLPYAIVLDCEAAWSRRFMDHTFTIPDWFITDKNGLGIEDFCLALFPIVSYVGRSLAAMREPGFE
ncbi:MAG: hypothetical protein BWY19_00072 [bacterium ADurb.Bin212]|nr:MAG: hypothetical protein BWY19_00072 [bacterium ADurb.Bin212]